MDVSKDDSRPKNQRPLMQPMEFYLVAQARCPDCDHEEKVVINKDKFVYHECNQGNVMAEVPTFELPNPQEEAHQGVVKFLEEGRKKRK